MQPPLLCLVLVFTTCLVTVAFAQENPGEIDGRTLTSGIHVPFEPPCRSAFDVIGFPQKQPPFVTYRAPRVPPYIASPPPVIGVGSESQVFVDDFLIESNVNASRVWHQGVRIGYFEEELGDFLGAAWVDGIHTMPSGGLQMWYACESTKVCTRTSEDGTAWGNRKVCSFLNADGSGVTNDAGSNAPARAPAEEKKEAADATDRAATLRLPFRRESGSVVEVPQDQAGILRDALGRQVKYLGAWFQFEGNPHHVPGRGASSKSELPFLPLGRVLTFTSHDGLTWIWTGMATEPQSDSSTVFYNPLRRKFAFSIKQGFLNWVRYRRYYEVDDLTNFTPFHGAFRCFLRGPRDTRNPFPQWKGCYRDGHPQSCYFLAADAADGRYDHRIWVRLNSTEQKDPADIRPYESFPRVPDLYSFTARGVGSSLMVGVGSITKSMSVARPHHIIPQLFFSRDGFHFARPPGPERRPLISEDFDSRAAVVCGGIVEHKDKIILGCQSVAMRVPEDLRNESWTWPRQTRISFYALRRDGYASLSGSSAMFVTKVLRVEAVPLSISLNVFVPPGGRIEATISVYGDASAVLARAQGRAVVEGPRDGVDVQAPFEFDTEEVEGWSAGDSGDSAPTSEYFVQLNFRLRSRHPTVSQEHGLSHDTIDLYSFRFVHH